MASPVRLVLLGTGTPDPRPHRGGTSVLLRLGERGVVFDLGPGATRNFHLAGLNPLTIEHIFFTHHHFDHTADFGQFVLTRWDQGAGRGDHLHVYGPPPLRRIVERLFGPDGVYGPDLEARAQHPMSQQIYRERGGVMPRRLPQFDVQELTVGDAVDGDGWSLTTGNAEHAQPFLRSLAYRIETAAGAVVISGDTRPLPEMPDFARDAHTLVHMAMDLDEARARLPDVYGSCTTAGDAGRIAAAAGVRRLVMVHLSAAMDVPDRQQDMIAEAGAAFDGEVVVGADGLELPVEPGG